jgi:Ser/Thr protein kinase RdoA (MazF antagonist)
VDETPYSDLDPGLILDAVESLGLVPDGRLLALNSYENRVYQIGVDEADPIVAKFYRPGRWTDESIREEHAFTLELADHELPVVAPMVIDGQSLHIHRDYRFTLFPRVGGRAPELEGEDTLLWIGRLMGRLHAVGRSGRFEHREMLTIERFGRLPARRVLESPLLPAHLGDAYRQASDGLIQAVEAAFERAGNIRTLRIHGDCHPGNLLWAPSGPLFVDLDDCITGPAIQDLWMLLSGDRQDRIIQLGALLEGYEQFSEFDPRELHLAEALRGLRMLHHAGWIIYRWQDPAFPAAFPWAAEARWWEDHVASLNEQAEACDAPPLPY